MAFGPQGEIAAGYIGRGAGVVHFDVRGKRLRSAPLKVGEGLPTSVAFDPEGKIAAGYGVLGGGRVAHSGRGVVLFDALGERLRGAPMEVAEGFVTSVAFGPEGKVAAGFVGVGSIGGVVQFDARGERLQPVPLEVKEGLSRAWPSVLRARSLRDMASKAFATASRAWWSSTSWGSGSEPPCCRPKRAMSRAWPSVRGTWSPRDMPSEAAAGWCCWTPAASGSDRRRLKSRRALSRRVAFGPGGKVAAGYAVRGGGGVVLFDAWGERLRLAPLEFKEGFVTSVAFGPGGKIAAGYGFLDVRGGVVLLDACGQPLVPAPLEVKEGGVMSVTFDPEGKIAAGYIGRRGAGVVLFDARGERLRPRPLQVDEGTVTRVAFGPEGKIAAGYNARYRGVGGVVLFDARGERLRPAPLEVKEGDITSVAFGPRGKIAVGYSVVVTVGTAGGFFSVRGGGGGVVLFDARGERLRPAPLEVKEGNITSVAFVPEGKIAAGYGGGGSGGVVFFDADPVSWRRKAPNGRSQLDVARVDAVLPRDSLPPHDPIPALAA